MRPADFLKSQFHLYRLWILGTPVAEVAAPAEPALSGIELRCLNRHERRDWVCEHSSEEDWPQFRTALQSDHDLVIATRKGKTIGWAWLGYERVLLPSLGRTLAIPAKTAYLYEAFVRPHERRRGVGTALVRARLARAREMGVEMVFTHVLERNHDSIRVLRAAGFRTLGRTSFLRALALGFWTRKPLAV